MTRNRSLFLIALAVLTFLVAGFTYQAATLVQQWEYKTSDSMNERKLNDLGSQGWELVTIDSKPMGMGGAISTYVFKRPKS